jgi:hypothetical protein
MEGSVGLTAPPLAEVAMVEREIVRQIRELGAGDWEGPMPPRESRGSDGASFIQASSNAPSIW